MLGLNLTDDIHQQTLTRRLGVKVCTLHETLILGVDSRASLDHQGLQVLGCRVRCVTGIVAPYLIEHILLWVEARAENLVCQRSTLLQSLNAALQKCLGQSTIAIILLATKHIEQNVLIGRLRQSYICRHEQHDSTQR